MNIEKTLADGCYKTSRVYGNMLTMLEDVMRDEEKLRELGPLDFSALGMYIGKFVEQEINSSVVQIMRAFRGVSMPEYYCKRFPGIVEYVDSPYKMIKINAQKYMDDRTSLKTIPLGDAFYALEQLKTEDKENFFARYPWLNEKEFLDAWQELFKFRNRMAHIGEIIDADILRENYEYFNIFLKYLPAIIKAKKELAPKGYQQALPKKKRETETSPYYASKYKYKREVEVHVSGCAYGEMRMAGEAGPVRPKRRGDEACRNAKVFKLRKGMRGLKDYKGDILVPANYDEFGFLPKLDADYKRRSVIAMRDGKYVLVALDGSGRELTNEPYDDIWLADRSQANSPYVYRKNGRMLWGFMDESGREMCGNIIENYVCGKNSVWYESGELKGYWNYGKGYPFLPPVFENIEILGEPYKLLLFTLNGVDGYVEAYPDDYKFIPLADLEKLDEEDRRNTFECCICEE